MAAGRCNCPQQPEPLSRVLLLFLAGAGILGQVAHADEKPGYHHRFEAKELQNLKLPDADSHGKATWVKAVAQAFKEGVNPPPPPDGDVIATSGTLKGGVHEPPAWARSAPGEGIVKKAKKQVDRWKWGAINLALRMSGACKTGSYLSEYRAGVEFASRRRSWRGFCPEGSTHGDGWTGWPQNCYENCQDNYRRQLGVCYRECPAGWRLDATTNTCVEPCPDNFQPNACGNFFCTAGGSTSDDCTNVNSTLGRSFTQMLQGVDFLPNRQFLDKLKGKLDDNNNGGAFIDAFKEFFTKGKGGVDILKSVFEHKLFGSTPLGSLEKTQIIAGSVFSFLSIGVFDLFPGPGDYLKGKVDQTFEKISPDGTGILNKMKRAATASLCKEKLFEPMPGEIS